MTQKKIIFIGILFLLVDLGVSLYFFVYKLQPTFSPAPNKIIAPAVFKKVETLSENYQNKPLVEKFTYQGKINIRENALVEKILTAGKIYQLKLDSGSSQIVELNSNTYLGTAWYGLDANNNLTDIRYNPIDIEKIKAITVNAKVAIRYLEENKTSQTLDLLEFVILK